MLMVTEPHVPVIGGLGVTGVTGGSTGPPAPPVDVMYPSPVHDPSVILISSSIM